MSETGKKRKSTFISRRETLLGAGALALAMPAVWRPARASQQIVVADPGGVFEAAFGEAFYRPFTEETGIEVVSIARRGSPSAQVKGIVETRNYIWDVVSLGSGMEKVLAPAGMLEPLELTAPAASEIPDNMKTPYWMGIDVIAFVIAYRTDAMGQDGPSTYAEVWDVEKFPGRRALRHEAREVAENAMRAAGVPTGPEMYAFLGTPEGWDLAFATLDKIKPHVNVWWTGSAQASQLLYTGEVDICPTWNARAQEAIDNGAPVKIEWNEGAYEVEGWSIPKGNPKADLARQFIGFCARADRQAAYTALLAYGPTNPNAYALIDAERAKLLPTAPAHFNQMAAYDMAFWAEHRDKANDRFAEWLLQ